MSSLEKAGAHADRLDAAADAMQKDGVGLHPTLGHAALLRRMASSMRADAAGGKVPHEFNDRASMYASTVGAPLPGTVIRTLSAASLPADQTITLADFDAAMSKTDLPIADRIAAKRVLTLAGRLT